MAKRDQLKSVIGTAIGAALGLGPASKSIVNTPNALGATNIQPTSVLPGYQNAVRASKQGLGAVVAAGAIGAAHIAVASARATTEARSEDMMRDTPAVGLGKKTKFKAGTTRRIHRATGGY